MGFIFVLPEGPNCSGQQPVFVNRNVAWVVTQVDFHTWSSGPAMLSLSMHYISSGFESLMKPVSRSAIERQKMTASMVTVSSVAGSSSLAMDSKVCSLWCSFSLSSCSYSLSISLAKRIPSILVPRFSLSIPQPPCATIWELRRGQETYVWARKILGVFLWRIWTWGFTF